MKIAIVGCGLNSDYHINFAKSYPGLQIIGVVDKDQEKAQECIKRFSIPKAFSSIYDLVNYEKPDVIHIVTPPRTHFELTKEAIESGCHVLVEKPLALNHRDAMTLYGLAEQRGVRLCTIHNHFFDPCMAKANEAVRSGAVGQVINVESYYGINTRIPAFRDYPAPNKLPWIYDLPGGVYHDFMAHPLYVLLEYTGRPREIKVMQQSHGILPQGLPDELRILIDGEKAFGTLTFSFAANPHLHFIRIYGTKMMVEVDINTMTTVTHPLSSLPKAAQKATYNLQESWQLFRSTTSNVYQFLTGKLKPYQGMKVLIHEFYDAIRTGSELPVTKEQALLVLQTMDEIWKQMKIPTLVFENTPPGNPYTVRHEEKILVTGGTGFLGKRLVEILRQEGYPVRVLARKLANVEGLRKMGVEIFFGDVADRESIGQSMQGVTWVVHAAAGTSGNEKDSLTGTLLGTKNVLELCRERDIKKLVYISSCSVYGVADYKNHQIVGENSTLERFPDQRGNYSASKQQAEAYVQEAMKKKDYPIVILRPGTIYGPGGDLFTPIMGFSLSSLFVVIGNGKFELPFVYVDNLVQAILSALRNPKADNRIFNVVDSDRMNKRDYMKGLIKKVYPKSRVVYFPFSMLYTMVWTQELLCRAMKRGPFLTRYRLISSQRNIHYDNTALVEKLNWTPVVSKEKAFENIVRHELGKWNS